MKPRILSVARLSFPLATALAALLAAPSAQAFTYYWDDNAAGTGFGTAGASLGTWAAPTAGTVAGWSTSTTGANAYVNVTTATTDTVNFGNGATGLAAGTITVAGTVSTGNMTFASGSGAITLFGGIINLGGGRTITSSYTAGVNVTRAINSELALSGASTFTIGEIGTGGGTRQLTLGKLSGTGGTTFQYTGGNNGTGLILLNAASTYTGTTLISTSLTNANTEVRLGVDNALPTTTILTIGGVEGTGTAPGRKTQLNLNGNDQTLAGLATTGGGTLRTQNVFSSTAATLTINNSSTHTFDGLIGNGGTAVTVIKQGLGVWILSGANTYVGQTTVSAGTITVSDATALGTTAGNTVVSTGGRIFVGTSSLSVAEPFNITGTGSSSNGAINIGGSATGVAFTGAITLGGDATIQGDSGTGTTFSGGINLGANTLTFKESGTITVNTAAISGTGGSIVKNTGGQTNLNFANTYTGDTTVNAGLLSVNNNSALGTTGGATTVASGAELQLGNGITITGETLNIAGGGLAANLFGALRTATGANAEWAGTVNLGASTRMGAASGTTLTVSGNITGAQPLLISTQSGTGTVLFTSTSNAYTGDTQIVRGILKIGATNALPTGTTLDVDFSSATEASTFDLNGFDQTVAGLQRTNTGGGTGGSIVTNSGGSTKTLEVNQAATTSFSGTLTGDLALTKSGAGSLTLSGTNTYTGTTTVSAGILRATTSASALGAGALSLGGGTLQLAHTAGLNFARNTTVTANSTITADRTTSSTTSLTHTLGTLSIGAQTLNITRGTNITSAGVGGITFLATTLTGNATFDTGTSSILTLGAVDGGFNLTKLGVGTLTLNGVNTYTGTTTITAGALGTALTDNLAGYTNAGKVIFDGGRLNVVTGDGTTTGWTVAQVATLLTNATKTSGTLGITVANGDVTETAFDFGGLSLVKSGINTLILNQAHTLGGTTITNGGGTLQITDAAALGAGAVTIQTAGTNTGTLEFALTGTNTITNTFNGFNSANALGSGMAQIQNTSGTNEITSDLTVTGAGGNGLNVVSNGGLLTLSGTITHTITTSGRTLSLGGSGNGLVSGAINDNTTNSQILAVTKSGAGTWTLSNNLNGYTGATTVSAGSLIINGAVASTSVVVNASLGGSGSASAATLSGSGAVNPGNSPGIFTASAANPSGGLDFNFEFSAEGTDPTWSNATASVNDVLRLTNATPFTAALSGTNTVSIYLNVASIAENDVFTGGFYTDNNAAFLASISSADFQYYIADPSGTDYNGVLYSLYNGSLDFNVNTIQVASADFAGGTITNGFVTQFTVIPEPNVAALIGALGGILLFRRRR